MYLSSGDLHGSLLRCFQLMAGVVREKSGGSFSSTKINQRWACQVNMALASQVISFIEAKLPEPVSNYYRWVYGAVEDAEACYFLARYCWSEVDSLLEGRRIAVRDNLAGLKLLVPFEARCQALNGAKKRFYSRDVLANVVGVDPSSYRRTYAKVWVQMVDVILALGSESSEQLGIYIDRLVGDELQDSPALSAAELSRVRSEAAERKQDFSARVDSSSFARVGHVGANVVVDDAVTQEDVDAYLRRGGVIDQIKSEKMKKAS